MLGVSAQTSDAEVKRAYRRLLSQHHPDQLVSKALPEETMKSAGRRRMRFARPTSVSVKRAGAEAARRVQIVLILSTARAPRFSRGPSDRPGSFTAASRVCGIPDRLMDSAAHRQACWDNHRALAGPVPHPVASGVPVGWVPGRTPFAPVVVAPFAPFAPVVPACRRRNGCASAHGMHSLPRHCLAGCRLHGGCRGNRWLRCGRARGRLRASNRRQARRPRH